METLSCNLAGLLLTKVIEYIWHYEQWQFEQQWDDYKNNVIAYGRSNRNLNGEYLNYGKSGEVIRMGAGLKAQIGLLAA